MTYEGLWEMFEGNSADMCAGEFPLTSMGGRAEGLACADLGARTPIGASGICCSTHLKMNKIFHERGYPVELVEDNLKRGVALEREDLLRPRPVYPNQAFFVLPSKKKLVQLLSSYITPTTPHCIRG